MLHTENIFNSTKPMDFSESFPDFETMIDTIEATHRKITKEREKREAEKLNKLKNHINYTYNCFMTKITDELNKMKHELDTVDIDSEELKTPTLVPGATINFEYYYTLSGYEVERANRTGSEEAKQVLNMVVCEMDKHGYYIVEEYVAPTIEKAVKIKFSIIFKRWRDDV